jgi:hypothetical protein
VLIVKASLPIDHAPKQHHGHHATFPIREGDLCVTLSDGREVTF